MDPADTEAFRKAIESQGSLVGQHSRVLQEVMEALQKLTTNVAQIRNHLDQVSAHLPSLAPQPDPVASAPYPIQSVHYPREPHVPAPERYAGDLGTCRAFLIQCSLVFGQQPLTYSSESSKIAYIMGLLKGKALEWASAVWDSHSPVCLSYHNFTSEMKKIFDHSVKGPDAAKRLFNIRQGGRSVAEYAVEFRITSADAGWNDLALRGGFMNGLSDTMKDELASRDDPDCLEELISLSIKLDNRLRERRREKAARLPSTHQSRSSQPPSSKATSDFALATSPLSSASFGEEPMQLDRARLSPAERLRRRQAGECIYCAKLGHFLASCPLRPKERARQ